MSEVRMRIPDPEHQARIRAEAAAEGITFVTVARKNAALRAAAGVLQALPKACQSRRRREVLRQVREAIEEV